MVGKKPNSINAALINIKGSISTKIVIIKLPKNIQPLDHRGVLSVKNNPTESTIKPSKIKIAINDIIKRKSGLSNRI